MFEQAQLYAPGTTGQDGSVIVQEVKTLSSGQGYDAARDEFGDMLQRGIIDPLKVTRSALENAVSIAGMFQTPRKAR